METNNWSSDKLLEIAGNYWAACAIHTAVELDVFTVLDDSSAGVEDIARELAVDARALQMLLNALTALKLLTKNGGQYTNTPVSRTCLAKDSPQYIGYMIMHHAHLSTVWVQMADAIRSGKPVRDQDLMHDPEQLENFLMGMFNLASSIAPQIAETVDLSDRKQLLDLGGGPGTYAIHFCKKNPGLRATVFDRPTTRPFAEKTIQQFNLAGQIQFVAGDFHQEEIEGRYDAVWISHILHQDDPESCQSLLQKAASVLEPGGKILIHDFLLDDTLDGPLYSALFSLNMLLNTPAGQSYSGGQIMAMLALAGVGEIQRIPYRGVNDSGIISGVVSQ